MTIYAYIIQDREDGNKVNEFTSYDEAETALIEYEAEDKAIGVYKPNFYEIVEVELYTTTTEFDLFN